MSGSNRRDDCEERYGASVSAIKFADGDTATDGYRNLTDTDVYLADCTELPASWTDMTIDRVLPVPSGTPLIVTCNDGFTNQGDDLVTCVENSNFTYSEAPKCVMGT